MSNWSEEAMKTYTPPVREEPLQEAFFRAEQRAENLEAELAEARERQALLVAFVKECDYDEKLELCCGESLSYQKARKALTDAGFPWGTEWER